MKKTTRNYIWVLAANFLLLLAVGVIWQARLETKALAKDTAGHAGIMTVDEIVPLPDAAFLKDLKTRASLSDFKGQWILINLWASWCGPCIVEMPSLKTFAHDYKSKGLHVIAISVDIDRKTVEKAVKTHNFGDFAHNWDNDGQMMEVFNPPALPVSMLIDPAGNLRGILSGEYDWSDPALRKAIDQFLQNAAS